MRACGLQSGRFRSLWLVSILLGSALAVRAQTSTQPCDCPAPQSAPPAATSGSSSGNSIAAAARSAKAQKANRATKVFTDDDMEVIAGPLPHLKLDATDNTKEVVDAIVRYRASHKLDETERVVRAWFDRYDQMLAAAIQENQNVMSIRNVNVANAYDMCQESENPQQCKAPQMADIRGARADSNVMLSNSNLITKITQGLLEVRTGLTINNMRYDWFKVRTPTGTDI